MAQPSYRLVSLAAEEFVHETEVLKARLTVPADALTQEARGVQKDLQRQLAAQEKVQRRAAQWAEGLDRFTDALQALGDVEAGIGQARLGCADALRRVHAQAAALS